MTPWLEACTVVCTCMEAHKEGHKEGDEENQVGTWRNVGGEGNYTPHVATLARLAVAGSLPWHLISAVVLHREAHIISVGAVVQIHTTTTVVYTRWSRRFTTQQHFTQYRTGQDSTSQLVTPLVGGLAARGCHAHCTTTVG